jgi:hypothetical protein
MHRHTKRSNVQLVRLYLQPRLCVRVQDVCETRAHEVSLREGACAEACLLLRQASPEAPLPLSSPLWGGGGRAGTGESGQAG